MLLDLLLGGAALVRTHKDASEDNQGSSKPPLQCQRLREQHIPQNSLNRSYDPTHIHKKTIRIREVFRLEHLYYITKSIILSRHAYREAEIGGAVDDGDGC